MEKLNNELDTLYQQRDEFIKKEDYYKADEINKKIIEYKAKTLSSQRKNFDYQNDLNAKSLEENFEKEMGLLNKEWANKEKELFEELALKEEQLKTTQKEEIEYLKKNIDNNYIQRISPNYLNLKKIQNELVKQERYIEAAEVKKKAEKLLKEEEEKRKLELKDKYLKMVDKMRKRHNDERNKFQEDKQKKIYMLLKEKNKEVDALTNRFRSLRVEVLLQQKEKEMKETKRLKSSMRRHNSLDVTRNTTYINIPLSYK